MQDRSYVKWAPFNSLFNDKVIIREIIKKKELIDKPALSEDQINYLNNKIFDAYVNHIKVNVSIYKNQHIINIIGYINNIDSSRKRITLNNNYIYFNQVINISNYYDN